MNDRTLTSNGNNDSTERYYSEMESARNVSMDAYFGARPQLLKTHAEQALYRAGFERAFQHLWNKAHGSETGALREALENISTVRPLEHFPAVTALAYCREKAIEALNATSAFQEVIVGEYEADGKVSMASSPLPEGTKLYARLPLRHSEKAGDQQS